METVRVDQTINSTIEGGGADRDDLLPVALAVGAFPDAPPDRVAVAARAGRGGDLPGLGELGPQPPGHRRAADDLLEPPVGEKEFEAVVLVLVDVARAGVVVVPGGAFDSSSPQVDELTKWFIRQVAGYDGGFSLAGDVPCVARRFACAT